MYKRQAVGAWTFFSGLSRPKGQRAGSTKRLHLFCRRRTARFYRLHADYFAYFPSIGCLLYTSHTESSRQPPCKGSLSHSHAAKQRQYFSSRKLLSDFFSQHFCFPRRMGYVGQISHLRTSQIFFRKRPHQFVLPPVLSANQA